MFRFKTFVEASAPWAARKQSGSSILELESADHAAQSVTQRTAFAPAAVPLTNYPEEENRRKKNQQVDGDERCQADADHGAVPLGLLGLGVAMSLPHSTVAVPHVVAFSGAAGEMFVAGKRESRR